MKNTYHVSSANTTDLLDFLVLDLRNLVSGSLSSINTGNGWDVVIHDLGRTDN